MFADEVLCGADGARLIGRRHGGHVEVERQQAAVGVAEIERTFGRDLGVGQARDGRHAVQQRGRGLDFFELLKLQEGDGLGVAVFGDRKILRGESDDRLAALVLHGHLLHHEARLGTKDGWLLCCRGRGGLLRGDGEGRTKEERKEAAHG